MYYELSKREKKIARQIIDKGADIEFKLGLKKVKALIAEWENGNLDNRESYHKLFQIVKEHDKRIAKRYDGLGGSRYLFTVAAILYDKQITQEEIKDFSDDAKEWVMRWISIWNEE